MKVLLKSFVAGALGSGLFFFFFMMLTVIAMSVMARLTSQPLEASNVVVTPLEFLRRVGLPLTGVTFAVTFFLARRRFRRTGSEPRA